MECGRADYGKGQIDKWREHLGHDRLVAQHCARAMTEVWAKREVAKVVLNLRPDTR